MSGYAKWTFEEIGKGQNKYIAVEIEYDAQEAEPATYDYPGCPAYAEPTSVKVIEFGTNTAIMNNFGDWEPVLDKIAEKLVEQHWGEISVQISEEIADAGIAAYEAHMESRWESLTGR